MISMSAYAQQVVKGTVKDATTKLPVPGATVKVIGSSKGATTNEKGEFEITVPANAQLQISSVGFENVVVPASLIQTKAIMMKMQAISLTDAVVVGYGTQQRSRVTNAISKVGSDALSAEKNIVSDVGKALQGRVAGVFVANSSGTPGSTPIIQIRGVQTTNAVYSNPLLVIDGLIVEGSTISLNSINPQDIESVEVLKDAASAAIYGARGSTGVIIVTTKKGKLNSKPTFNVNAYTGLNGINTSRRMLTTDEYKSAFTDARQNRIGDINQQLANPGQLPPSQINRLNAEKTRLQSAIDGLQMADRSTDWIAAVKNNHAPINNIQASMNGGTDKGSYYMSLGRYAETMAIGRGSFERYTGRLDLTQQVNTWLKLNGNINITQSANKDFSNPIIAAFNARPDTPKDPVRNADGSLGYYAGQQQHPIGVMNDVDSKIANTSYFGGLSAEIKLHKTLQFRSSYNVTKYNVLSNSFQSPLGYAGAFNQGYYTTNGNDNFSYNFDNYFTYNNRWKKLGVNGTLGYTFYNNQLNYFGYEVDGFPKIDGITGAASATTYGSVFGIAGKNLNNKEISDAYFLRGGFDWDGKYLLNASIRRDGSSKLPASNRYSWFPSISAGWDIAKENFLAHNTWINQLKLRSSYGISGNIRPVGYFDAQNLLVATTNVGDQALKLNSTIGNPDIHWERTKQVDAGIDMAFLQSRFTVALDYYNKTTDGLLSKNNVSWVYGAAAIPDNIGNIRNYGVDLELGIHSAPGAVIGWGVETNFNVNRNKILSMKDSLTNYGAFVFGGPFSRAKVGQSVGSVQVYQSLGVDPQTGDMMYKDVNNDKKWDTNDMVTIPIALPEFTGGTNLSLSYKAFKVEALFNYVVGNKVYDFYEQSLRNYDADYTGVMNNKFDIVNKRWKKPGDITDVPRAITGVHGAGQTTDWNYRPSTQFVYDASYVRLRNLTVAYTVPASMLSKAKISRARLYASAQNLFTLTRYIGFDPEAANITGIVSTNLPNPRSMVIGIDLSF